MIMVKQGKVTDYEIYSFFKDSQLNYRFVLEIDENYELVKYIAQNEYSIFVSRIIAGFEANELLGIIEKEASFEVDENDRLTKLLFKNNIEILND